MTQRDLILEIGCEEIPAQDQLLLARALESGLLEALREAQISFGESRYYATPRRIALLLRDLADTQQTREIIKRGPALERAFDAAGQPTPATLGFARANDVGVAQLERMTLEKGDFLVYRQQEGGGSTDAVLPELIQQAVSRLPLRKRMRWGSSQASFVRPVQWLLARFGDAILPMRLFDQNAQGGSFGHRVHHPGALALRQPSDYADSLHEGRVMADFSERRAMISDAIQAKADELGGEAYIPETLLDEVTGLVEWPVVLAGGFEQSYLDMPPELLSTVMIQHQRYFPVFQDRAANRLSNHFIFVANLESRDPAAVTQGNSRVLRARLADADFFWTEDRKLSLEARRPDLAQVLFQQGLGSLLDKSERLTRLAPTLAEMLDRDTETARRAAFLCKCDLMTGMVSEFPELQGVMGSYYARHDGETAAVSACIGGHYAPAGRGDAIPVDPGAQVLSLADKFDTLVGFFAIGRIPSGDKDPFALRRAALGVLRILLEGHVSLDLARAIEAAGLIYQDTADISGAAGHQEKLLDFLLERLRILFREDGHAPDLVEAVLSMRPTDPLDARSRLQALSRFRERPEAETLAAANKRISNILRKEGIQTTGHVAEELLLAPAERELWQTWKTMQPPVEMLLRVEDYGQVLDILASLRAPVDRFFDEVMVMDEDIRIRDNRLALIGGLRDAFLQVADLSMLQG